MGIGAGRTKHMPRNEFLDFACAQLNKEFGAARKTGPHRPSVVIRSEEITHHERQIARLTDLEKRQAQKLASTRQVLRKHRARLGQARQALKSEIAAIRSLDGADTDPTASPDGRTTAG